MFTSLYLHIPFCTTKCTYCAFNTYTNFETLYEPFTQALIREIELVAHATRSPVATAPLTIGTVFLGGGTPSLLTPDQLGRILQAVRQHFEVLPTAEITMEANPNDLTDITVLQAIRETGINRLSVGMQSAHARDLTLFARRHDHAQVIQAVANIRAAGFENFNLDLIYGTPNQTLADWDSTLTAAIGLAPHHLSLYALGLEEGTPLKTWVDTGKVPTPDDDLTADMYDLATQRLGEAGYGQYEISNWARAGYESRHNLQYWYNEDYIGLGPGAHGYAGGVRYATLLSPQRYIKALLDAPTSPWVYPHTPAVDQSVTVGRTDDISETLMMGLRLTQRGIIRAEFKARFGVDLLELHGAVIEKYVAYGVLEYDADRVRLTSKGRLLSNSVFRELV